MTYDFFILNFFPVVGSLLLLIFLWRNSNLNTQVRNTFYLLVAISLVELFTYNLELIYTGSHVSKYTTTLVTCIGYILRPLMLYLLIKIFTRNFHSIFLKIFLLIPIIINTAFALSTYVTDSGYYYDEFNVFHRGPYGWTSHAVMIVYLLTMIILSFIKQSKNPRFERTIIIEIALLITFAAFAESLFSNYAVLRTAITTSLIFYYMFFQSQIYKDEMSEKNIEQEKKFERFSLQVVTALASTVDAKDSYTKGHSLRVAEYSKEIARRLGQSEEYQRNIYFIGMLHDIGKIGIPDNIIKKTGRLTDEEYEIIKSHPVIGEEVLKNITEIPHLSYGARWHHEHYDGSGYPDGISGEAIPLEARIIAVADAYDAMSSKRSYRDALSQQTIRDEIVRVSGSQLDPELADILLDMMDEDIHYEMREA